MSQRSFSSASFGAAKPAKRHQVEDGLLARSLDLYLTWRARRRSRSDLMGLPDDMLKDIGLSRGEAELEYEKPFWRG